MGIDLNAIPGRSEAIFRQTFVRDAAFLGVTENVAGYECLPLSVWHLTMLRTMCSPLLVDGATPDAVQLASFLWIVSKDYTLEAGDRNAFYRRCREFSPPAKPFIHWSRSMTRWHRRNARSIARLSEVIQACRDYVAETFQDIGPRAGGNSEPDYVSEPCYICARLAREFGFSVTDVMAMPLKQVFQFLNECRMTHGSKTPLTNPHEAVEARYFATLNENARQ